MERYSKKKNRDKDINNTNKLKYQIKSMTNTFISNHHKNFLLLKIILFLAFTSVKSNLTNNLIDLTHLNLSINYISLSEKLIINEDPVVIIIPTLNTSSQEKEASVSRPNLGACEEKLKEYYNIDKNEDLIIY